MSDRTNFAGLLRLDPAESLATDGFAFQALNPLIIDRLLRMGAVAHRHDAHPALVQLDPTPAPVVAVLDNGGAIPADTEIHVGYTLVDADGGETTLNDSPAVVTTDEGLVTPDELVTLAVDHDAGTLLAGNYYYAVTLTDGAGGETGLSPTETITIDPGFPTSRITISGLADILASVPGAVTWRLWRSIASGRYTMMAEGATDAVVDDGSLCPDCGAVPPTSTGSTRAVSRLQVTVPGGQPARAVRFRVYASPDGSFTSPCLLGDYPIAETGAVKEYLNLAVLEGAPPAVSSALPGANRIDAETELTNFTWRAPVATAAALPGGATAGEARVVLDSGSIYVFRGGAWSAVAGGGGGGGGGDYEMYGDYETPPTLDAPGVRYVFEGATVGRIVLDEISGETRLFNDNVNQGVATDLAPLYGDDGSWERVDVDGQGRLQLAAGAVGAGEKPLALHEGLTGGADVNLATSAPFTWDVTILRTLADWSSGMGFTASGHDYLLDLNPNAATPEDRLCIRRDGVNVAGVDFPMPPLANIDLNVQVNKGSIILSAEEIETPRSAEATYVTPEEITDVTDLFLRGSVGTQGSFSITGNQLVSGNIRRELRAIIAGVGPDSFSFTLGDSDGLTFTGLSVGVAVDEAVAVQGPTVEVAGGRVFMAGVIQASLDASTSLLAAGAIPRRLRPLDDATFTLLDLDGNLQRLTVHADGSMTRDTTGLADIPLNTVNWSLNA